MEEQPVKKWPARTSSLWKFALGVVSVLIIPLIDFLTDLILAVEVFDQRDCLTQANARTSLTPDKIALILFTSAGLGLLQSILVVVALIRANEVQDEVEQGQESSYGLEGLADDGSDDSNGLNGLALPARFQRKLEIMRQNDGVTHWRGVFGFMEDFLAVFAQAFLIFSFSVGSNGLVQASLITTVLSAALSMGRINICGLNRFSDSKATFARRWCWKGFSVFAVCGGLAILVAFSFVDMPSVSYVDYRLRLSSGEVLEDRIAPDREIGFEADTVCVGAACAGIYMQKDHLTLNFRQDPTILRIPYFPHGVNYNATTRFGEVTGTVIFSELCVAL